MPRTLNLGSAANGAIAITPRALAARAAAPPKSKSPVTTMTLAPRSISSCAATAPCGMSLLVSRISSFKGRPSTPPLAFTSSIAICAARAGSVS